MFSARYARFYFVIVEDLAKCLDIVLRGLLELSLRRIYESLPFSHWIVTSMPSFAISVRCLFGLKTSLVL